MSNDPTLPIGSGSQPRTYQPPEGTNLGSLPPRPGGAAPGQPAYYGVYPGPMAPGTSGYAIASLILSIASYLGLPLVGAVLGVIFGHMALTQINQSGGQTQGRGMAVAGLILGYAHFVVLLCVVAAILASAGLLFGFSLHLFH